MCGIAGAVHFRGPAVRVTESLAAISHRGPDGEGEYTEGPVWLGHRRLAIIDVGPAGTQPMTIEGAGSIVFNGEIYDYSSHRRRLEGRGVSFTTHSDTEVLLRALALDGVQVLRGLHGMYAFAWLEPGGKKLWLARDHAGMKPLYYWQGAGGFAFASEVRGLAPLIRALGGQVRSNGASLAQFLASGSVPEPETVLLGARMLPRDAHLCVDIERGSVSPPEDTGGRRALLAEVVDVDRPQDAINASALRHLVADTPVALFLSGGIDSGLLALLTSRAEPKPTAISITLGSRGTEDEPELVKKLAQRCGLRLEQVSIDDWRSRLQHALSHYDQPSIDGMNTFLISGVAHELGFKVALSGIGADEVFGGYRHMRLPIEHPPATQLGSRAGAFAGALLDRSRRPMLRRAGRVLEAMGAGQSVQLGMRRILGDSAVQALLPGIAPPPSPTTVATDALELEQSTYLQNTLLRDTDVMGMAQGVEIRAPFLDPAVLALGRRFGPRKLLSRQRPTKWPLREAWTAVAGVAPSPRGKTGFTLKIADWLLNEGREQLESARLGLERRACVDASALRGAWSRWSAELQSGHPSAWVPLFSMMQLEQQFARWGEP